MKNTISIGNAGEYLVAAELERRGFSVAVPMSNVEMFDILALNRVTRKQIAIQVKTNSSSSPVWLLKRKCEEIIDPNIFYIFVNMNELGFPTYHILPSQVVAKQIADNHTNWLNDKTKPNRKDGTLRKFFDLDNTYLNKWDILNQ